MQVYQLNYYEEAGLEGADWFNVVTIGVFFSKERAKSELERLTDQLNNEKKKCSVCDYRLHGGWQAPEPKCYVKNKKDAYSLYCSKERTEYDESYYKIQEYIVEE